MGLLLAAFFTSFFTLGCASRAVKKPAARYQQPKIKPASVKKDSLAVVVEDLSLNSAPTALASLTSSNTSTDISLPSSTDTLTTTAPVINNLEPTTLTYEVDAKVIGAVLPLSGKNASIGQRALNAIKMGLDLIPSLRGAGAAAAASDNKLRLAVFDSQSSPELAAQGADKLVKEDKAIALLGGFTAKEATALALRAEELRTPYIGFSQKSGLTAIGNYIFRNSVTPEMQVDKLVQFAFDQLSARRFAILFPNDTYGVEFSNIFWDHVLARGGEITAAQTYDPKENDFSEIIQKITGTYYLEARAEEYAEKQLELKASKAAAMKKNKKKGGRGRWTEEGLLSPIVDFDVLFIPDSSRTLGQIIAFMKYHEVTGLKYLGTNIWNSPDLPARTAGGKNSFYFVDALDFSDVSGSCGGAATCPSNRFFKDYLKLYGEEPTMVEVQAYESAKIIKNQLLSGVSTRAMLADNLRSLGRSPGITGELRMSSQREIERPIHVLTLDSGLVKKIK